MTDELTTTAPPEYGERTIASTPDAGDVPAFGFKPVPTCLACKRMMRVVRRNAHAEVRAGTAAAIWACSVYECVRCKCRVLADFSTGPICASTAPMWDDWRRDLMGTGEHYFVIEGAG